MNPSKTFCAMPFQHLCLGSEGTARICCMAHETVSEHGAPMSLNVHTMEEIWNSAYMRNIRRSMLKGDRISACETCYESEAKSGHSYRTNAGSQPIEGRDSSQAAMARFGRAAGYRADHPSFIKLEVGNLCNLKCRMCCSSNSSQIERDPVHARWSGGAEPLHAFWRGATARIGPEPRIGVRTAGLLEREDHDGKLLRWTDGHAVFNIPIQAGTNLKSLEICFHQAGVRGQHFEVILNGVPMTRGRLEKANQPLRLDLGPLASSPVTSRELVLEIVSDTFIAAEGGPRRGLPLSAISLEKAVEASTRQWLPPQLVASQRTAPGPWYRDDGKVFDDVLRSTDSLERLYITGGEPLINDRVSAILQHLIDKGVAGRIQLEISTNCTSINVDDIERLKKFRRAELLLSLDAVGDAYDYIRYPARWEVVDRNVRLLKFHHKIPCIAPPVVQAYNVLQLVDLFRYCDALGMAFTMNILHEPDLLAVHHLAPSVRRAAARKLLEYHDMDCSPDSKPQVHALAKYLHDLAAPFDLETTRKFMLFTNDLDATRGQSFRDTHEEFVRLLAEDGFEWTDEILFAKDAMPTRSARERDFAWI